MFRPGLLMSLRLTTQLLDQDLSFLCKVLDNNLLMSV